MVQTDALKSSVDKFYSQEDLNKLAVEMNAKPGDLILITGRREKENTDSTVRTKT